MTSYPHSKCFESLDEIWQSDNFKIWNKLSVVSTDRTFRSVNFLVDWWLVLAIVEFSVAIRAIRVGQSDLFFLKSVRITYEI